MKPEDVVARYYNRTLQQYVRRWAGTTGCLHYGYTDATHHTHAESLQNTVFQLIRVSGLRSRPAATPLRILDAGSGLGGGAILLAETLGAEVDGITLSTAQQRYATLRFGCEGRTPPSQGHVRFAVQDYRRVPQKDAYYDAVFFLESACHSDAQDLLKESYRLLKPGGVIAIADGTIRNDFALAHAVREYDRWRTRWHVHALLRLADWRFALVRRGFVGVHAEDWTHFVGPSIQRLGRQARRARPVARVLRVVGRMSDDAWANVEAAVLWDRLVASGACGYGAVSATKSP